MALEAQLTCTQSQQLALTANAEEQDEGALQEYAVSLHNRLLDRLPPSSTLTLFFIAPDAYRATRVHRASAHRTSLPRAPSLKHQGYARRLLPHLASR